MSGVRFDDLDDKTKLRVQAKVDPAGARMALMRKGRVDRYPANARAEPARETRQLDKQTPVHHRAAKTENVSIRPRGTMERVRAVPRKSAGTHKQGFWRALQNTATPQKTRGKKRGRSYRTSSGGRALPMTPPSRLPGIPREKKRTHKRAADVLGGDRYMNHITGWKPPR